MSVTVGDCRDLFLLLLCYRLRAAILLSGVTSGLIISGALRFYALGCEFALLRSAREFTVRIASESAQLFKSVQIMVFCQVLADSLIV